MGQNRREQKKKLHYHGTNESTHIHSLGFPSGMLGVHVHVHELSISDRRAISDREKLLPPEKDSAHD